MTLRRPASLIARRILDQRAFLERVQEEIARCLRTRRHLSVALLAVEDAADRAAPPGPANLRGLERVARHVARHVRAYDLVAIFDAGELALLFPETGREAAQAIVTRLCAAITARPGSPPAASRGDAWGIATWPADGVDASALLETARRRLSAARIRKQA